MLLCIAKCIHPVLLTILWIANTEFNYKSYALLFSFNCRAKISVTSPITVSSLLFIVQKSKFNFSKIQLRHVKMRIKENFWIFRFKSSLPLPYSRQRLLSASQLWLAMLKVKLESVCYKFQYISVNE